MCDWLLWFLEDTHFDHVVYGHTVHSVVIAQFQLFLLLHSILKARSNKVHLWHVHVPIHLTFLFFFFRFIFSYAFSQICHLFELCHSTLLHGGLHVLVKLHLLSLLVYFSRLVHSLLHGDHAATRHSLRSIPITLLAPLPLASIVLCIIRAFRASFAHVEY